MDMVQSLIHTIPHGITVKNMYVYNCVHEKNKAPRPEVLLLQRALQLVQSVQLSQWCSIHEISSVVAIAVCWLWTCKDGTRSRWGGRMSSF